MRSLVGARRSGRRACMYGAGAAVLLALAVAAAPDSGLFPSSRLADAPPAPKPTTTSAGGAPAPAAAMTHSPGAEEPSGPAGTTGGTRTVGAAGRESPQTGLTPAPTMVADSAAGNAAAPEKLYGRQPTTGTTPSSPGTPASTCQGTTPLGLPGQWTCTFDDEFNGPSLDTSNWVPQVTASSGYVNGATACYVNNPDTISVSGGYLNLSVRQVAPFTCQDGSNSFTASEEAGMVSTYGLFDQAYGAYEVSAKVPPSVVAGLQETFWLYPQNLTYGAWPASGEIDFAELYSSVPGLDVPFVHYSQSSTDPNATAYDCLINQDSFNTYGVDWTPTSITVLYNGTPCLVDHPTTGSQPFDQPFFIALTQALGTGTDAFTPGVTELPATTQVDWVRAWAPAS